MTEGFVLEGAPACLPDQHQTRSHEFTVSLFPYLSCLPPGPWCPGDYKLWSPKTVNYEDCHNQLTTPTPQSKSNDSDCVANLRCWHWRNTGLAETSTHISFKGFLLGRASYWNKRLLYLENRDQDGPNWDCFILFLETLDSSCTSTVTKSTACVSVWSLDRPFAQSKLHAAFQNAYILRDMIMHDHAWSWIMLLPHARHLAWLPGTPGWAATWA